MSWPTERTPTPKEFVDESWRRYWQDPRTHMVADAVMQIANAANGWAPGDPDHAGIRIALRMGACLGLLVDERFDVFIGPLSDADEHLRQLAEATPRITREQAYRAFGVSPPEEGGQV
jgi:hypothetical protein